MTTLTAGLAVAGLSYQYAAEPVLGGVDLHVGSGEAVAVMGPSGCGKSTLLLLAAGILAPADGSVTVAGEPLGTSPAERAAARRTRLGLVFQFGELIAELTLLDNVALAAELAGIRRGVALTEARDLLDRVGLADLSGRKPAEVSGGQAQRCAIARALVHRPAVVLADEPTGALDQANAAVVLDLMLEVTRERGAAILLATHDPTVAAACDRVVRMRDGAVIA